MVKIDDAPDTLPAVAIDPDDDMCIFYTSGTTGSPKGAQLTHRGSVHNLLHIGFMLDLRRGVAAARGIDLAAIEARTRKAGGEVVGLLGTGSAFVSPAWSALEMAESIAFDQRKIIPTCTLLEGEFGASGLFVGVPAILGKNGVEEIVEFELTEDEKAAFAHSVGAVQKTVDEVKAMG